MTVKNYLEGLTWDGVERIGRWRGPTASSTRCWLIYYFGVSVLHGGAAELKRVVEVGRRFMLSAVARALEPGCQVDATLVLVGPVGCGKSSAIRVLACDEYYCGLVGCAVPPGAWIIELTDVSYMVRERASFRASLKGFLARQSDIQRHAIVPRTCTHVVTSSESASDATAVFGRRFDVIEVVEIDLEAIRRDRDQLWAEAVAAYRAGEKWYKETA